MSSHLYEPSQEEREMVLRFIGENSGIHPTGQKKPEKVREGMRYPNGLTSFAEEVGMSPRQLTRILYGHGNTKRRIWLRITSIVHVNTEENADELRAALAKLRGVVEEVMPLLSRAI